MAASLAISTIKIFRLPSGGSVSLGCVPLIILAARHGFLTGLLCGFLQGCLVAAISPTIIHPIQFLLDYPLAYSCMGLAGLIDWNSDESNFINALKAVTATTAAYFCRMLMHVIAGTVFFSSGKGFEEALVFCFTYNLGHILPETILCGIFACLITDSKSKLCARQQ